MENKYINPVGLMDEWEKRKLFHLRSGVVLQDEIADETLNTFCKEQSL